MSGIMFRHEWTEEYEREIGYFREDIDPFENWDLLTLPESAAERWLTDALMVLYGRGERSIVNKFLTAAVAVVSRALAESKFTEQYAEDGFPRNRGEALRARAYAVSLSSEELLVDDLVQASADFEEWYQSYTPGEWDSHAEADLLSAVRAALIVGDFARASALLSGCRRFKWHKVEYAVCRGLAAGVDHDPSSMLHDQFKMLFDTVRDPHFSPDIYMETDIVRFELGAIYAMYFQPGGFKSWQNVVDLISA